MVIVFGALLIKWFAGSLVHDASSASIKERCSHWNYQVVRTRSAYVLRNVIELMGIISALFKESAFFVQRLFACLILSIAHRHNLRQYLRVAFCEDEADNSR